MLVHQTEAIMSFHNISTSNSSDVILPRDMEHFQLKEEVLLVFQISIPIRVALFCWKLMAGLINLGLKCLGIKHIWTHSLLDSPVNRILVMNQVAEIMFGSVLSVCVSSSILMARPISELFGHFPCHLFWSSIMGCLWLLATSGLSMALVRFLIVRMPNFAMIRIGVQNLTRSAVAIQLATVAGVMMFHHSLISAKGTSTSYQYCYGYSTEMAEMVWLHNQGGSYQARDQAEDKRKFILIFALGCFCLTLVLYASILWHLHRHDRDIEKRGVIGRDKVLMRRKKNAITAVDQAAVFAIEIIIIYVCVFVARSGTILGVQRTTIPTLTIEFAMALTVVSFLGSHEYRRHYNLGIPSVLVKVLKSRKAKIPEEIELNKASKTVPTNLTAN